MKLRPNIGALIQQARQDRPLSVDKLAEKITSTHKHPTKPGLRPVSPFTIRAYEQSRFQPSREIVEQLMIALNKPLSYFYDVAADAPGNQEDLRAQVRALEQQVTELKMNLFSIGADVQALKLKR